MCKDDFYDAKIIKCKQGPNYKKAIEGSSGIITFYLERTTMTRCMLTQHMHDLYWTLTITEMKPMQCKNETCIMTRLAFGKLPMYHPG